MRTLGVLSIVTMSRWMTHVTTGRVSLGFVTHVNSLYEQRIGDEGKGGGVTFCLFLLSSLPPSPFFVRYRRRGEDQNLVPNSDSFSGHPS